METSTIIRYAETEDELDQILKLQNANHKDNIPLENRENNGFVTAKHNLDQLKQMNASLKQIIAVDNDVVVGYALVMLKEHSRLLPVLEPMFDLFNQLTYKGKALSSYQYYVMGQICIAETHRGQGLFEKLYLTHKKLFSDTFELCLTEVSSKNVRSMRAHQKVGLEKIHSYEDDSTYWNIMLWDWRQ